MKSKHFNKIELKEKIEDIPESILLNLLNEYSFKDLKKFLKQSDLLNSTGFLNVMLFLNNEIRRRSNKKLEKLNKETKELMEQQVVLVEKTMLDNKRTSKWTLGLAGASLLFSLLAVGLSVSDYYEDKTWQKEQIGLLKKIDKAEIKTQQNERIIKLLEDIKNKKIIIKGVR